MASKIQCNYHPDSHLIEDYRAGDMICSECGLVVGDRVIDVSSEWRTFNTGEKTGEDRCRVGGPENLLLGSADLTTLIGQSKGGSSYFNQNQVTFANQRGLLSKERALVSAFGIISAMCDRINLPEVIKERSHALYKMVHEGQNLKGRSHEAVASACLYIACRQEGVPRTFKEIVAISSVDKKEIGRCFKLIVKAHDTNVEIITTGDFMHRFCSNLQLSKNAQRAATCIAKNAVDLEIVPGRSPISIAAAAIYMASQANGDKRTHSDISDIAGVSAGTIRQAYKLMLTRASELFPEQFEFTVPIDELPIN